MGKFRQEMSLFQAQLEAREPGKIRKVEQVAPGEESLIRFSVLQDLQLGHLPSSFCTYLTFPTTALHRS